MSQRTFLLIRVLAILAIVILVNWSIATGNVFLPIIAVVVGTALLYLASRHVKGVMKDERNYRISERACRITLGIFIPAIAVASAVLIILSKSSSTGLGQVGLTLAYSACALLVIYSISYLYFSSKS